MVMSVEEYLNYSSKPNCEYIDGVLRPKPWATSLHGLMQVVVGMLLYRQGVETATEVTVQVAPTRFLVPDVIAAESIGDPYPTEPVMLCVEILSPMDRLGEALAKCEEYHAWGVPNCWVIDPMKQTAWAYDAGCEPSKIPTDGALRAGKLTVELAELFSPLHGGRIG
jgi:Uma2 family endonuclease